MNKTKEATAERKGAVKVMTMNELNGKIAKGGSLQLLNVLEPKYYKLGMIRGTIKIPLAAKGFNVSAYEGGIKERAAAKLPVDASTAEALCEQNA